MNEQRRIMELFKERRKSRKKKGNNNKSSANDSGALGVSDGGGTRTADDGAFTAGDGGSSNETNTRGRSIPPANAGGIGTATINNHDGEKENERIKTDSNNPNEPEHIREKDDIPSATKNATSSSSLPTSPTPPNGSSTTTTSTSLSSTTKKKKRKKRRSILRSSPTTSSEGGGGGGGVGGDDHLVDDLDHHHQQQQQTEMLNLMSSAEDENSIDANCCEQPHQQQQQKPVSPSRPTPPPPPGLGGTTIPPPGFQDSFSSSLRLDNTSDHDTKTSFGLNGGLNGVGNDSLESSIHLDPLPLHGDFDATHLQHQQQQERQESNHSLEPNSLLSFTDTNTATTSTSMNNPAAITTTTTPSASPTFQDKTNPLSHSFTHHDQRRYIIIPEIDRPSVMAPSPLLQPKTSLAVAAAKAFVDLYYPHILHGLSSDLAMYYTPQAQKSISVGGAHSVVASQSDIMIQLSRFSGSNFVVRGVVSQDTFDGHGAHILVTGIVQTTLINGLTSFAHSISLVRKEQPLVRSSFTAGASISNDDAYSFQIHNDALSLLTVADMIANEQQNQQQQTL